MYKCINSQYGEGFYQDSEAFDDMVRTALGEDELELHDRGDFICVVTKECGERKFTPVLEKLYFVLRDGETTNRDGYSSLSAALEAVENEFGELVRTEEYDSETRVKTFYGELLATVAIDLASTEKDLELPETIAVTIVW